MKDEIKIFETDLYDGNLKIDFTDKTKKTLQMILECDPSKKYMDGILLFIKRSFFDAVNKEAKRNKYDIIKYINGESIQDYNTAELVFCISDEYNFNINVKYNAYNGYFAKRRDISITKKDLSQFKELALQSTDTSNSLERIFNEIGEEIYGRD